MKRFLLSAAAMVLGLALVGTVEAGDKKGGTHGGKSGGSPSSGVIHSTGSHSGKTYSGGSYSGGVTKTTFHKDYHLTYGVKSKQGFYYYKGYSHSHWSHQCWYPKYGCNCYWCPCTLVYYYWCVPDECYYPVTYCPYNCYSW